MSWVEWLFCPNERTRCGCGLWGYTALSPCEPVMYSFLITVCSGCFFCVYRELYGWAEVVEPKTFHVFAPRRCCNLFVLGEVALFYDAFRAVGYW
jgi:hypothetical protein